jgi:hypothetical protein
MIDIKQQDSNGLFNRNIEAIVKAASPLELIRGPYTPVRNIQTFNFKGILITPELTSGRIYQTANTLHTRFVA